MDLSKLNAVEIKTPRLLIRRLGMQDAQGLFALVHDQDTCDDDGGYAAFAEMDDKFMRMLEAFSKETGRFAIVLNGETIGTIHLMDPEVERAMQALEIGYCLNRDYRRRGYASEAVRAMIDCCRRELGVRLFVAGAFGFNEKSQRMLEKLGFEREGVTRFAMDHRKYGLVDMVNYSLLLD